MVRIDKYSDYCGRYGCNNDTVVALAIVENTKGKRIVGPISNFATEDRHKNVIVPIELKTEYSFVSWVTRCEHCYSEDIRNQQAKAAMV